MNPLRLFLAQLVTAGMVLAGVLSAFQYDWPDYVHTDYGVPLVWAIHTVSAFAGPVDIWRVDMTNLVADITIWTVLSLGVVALIDILRRKRA